MAEPDAERLVTAGRVGRPHGLDGSFRVSSPEHPLDRGTEVTVGGRVRTVSKRRGSADSPILSLEGVVDRESAAALAGQLLLVSERQAPLAPDEWLAQELVGCRVAGLGTVERVIAAPSCDVLELSDGTLVPLISDAVTSVDTDARTVEVDRAFLGLGDPG